MTASGLFVKPSIVDKPWVFSPVIAMTQPTSTAPVIIQSGRCLRATPAAIRPHRPCVARSVWWSTRGRLGQKIHRPQSTSSAGSTVSMTVTVQAMAIAQTGPRPAVELRSATVRQIRPRMTVTADAAIGWAAAFHATIIASSLLSNSCNSSRYLLTSSSA